MRLWAAVLAVVPLSGCVSPVRHAPLAMPVLPEMWSVGSGASRDPSSTASQHSDVTGLLRAPGGASDHSDESDAKQWWQAFGDAQLDALIAQALANNADLAMAAVRVRQAQLAARLVDAETGLQVRGRAGADAIREFDRAETRLATGAKAAVSFEIDLWGKLAARRDEAAWRAQASEADREAAALLLAATTAKLYWRIGYLNEAIALGDASIADAQQAAALIEARVAAGAATPLDAAQARQSIAILRAQQAQPRQEREAKRNALALLLDQPPEARRAEPGSLAQASLPVVAPGLPAVILARRPDLRAAELRLRARLADIDFARAAIYPSISLTGELGTSSDMLVRTLQNPVASIGAALALPFVQWNTVRLKATLSEAEFDEASIDFRRQLYRALADVEDALAAKAELDGEAAELEHAFENARLAARYARTRFEAGATDAGPWLESETEQRSAHLERTKNRFARLENRVDLFLALGGA